MADVFPPRVLPGRGEEWGRVVESRIEAGEKSEVQLEQKVDNGLRATSGQLAVLADQVTEIVEGRRSHYFSADDRTFSYNATSGATQGPTIPLLFPAPEGGSRSASISFRFVSKLTANGSFGTNVWPEILVDGVSVWRSGNSIPVGLGASTPPGWVDAPVDFFTHLSVLSSDSGPPDIALRLWFYDYQAQSGRVAEFSEIYAVLSYSDLL